MKFSEMHKVTKAVLMFMLAGTLFTLFVGAAIFKGNTPFIVGSLFGFGVGFTFAHYMHRLPRLAAGRKAAETRKRNAHNKTVKALKS
jgi:hypothetical protein